MPKQIAAGTKVKIVNFHGEEFPLTAKLGFGIVKGHYTEPGIAGEKRVEIFFPKSRLIGGYPTEMVKAI